MIAPYARGGTITAIRRGGAGDVTGSHLAWVRRDIGADVPTPAVKDGRMVVCTDKGVVEGLDAVTGKTMWRMELPKNRHAYSASPVIVDGRVIVVREWRVFCRGQVPRLMRESPCSGAAAWRR